MNSLSQVQVKVGKQIYFRSGTLFSVSLFVDQQEEMLMSFGVLKAVSLNCTTEMIK
jgi:hypothetical protein